MDELPGPLAGVRVIDFTRVIAGPSCTQTLVNLGAEVIKVEPPEGDLTRFAVPRAGITSAYFTQQNTGKRNVSLDLHRPEAVDLLLRIGERCDVLIENSRPGVMDRLGLGYDLVRQRNPGIVYCHTAGYDHTRAHLPGNDQTGNAVGGTEWEDGGISRGGRPYWSAASGGDLGNGYLSAFPETLFDRLRAGLKKTGSSLGGLFGANKIPTFMKGLGTGIKEFKKASRDVQDEVHRAMDADEHAQPPAPRPASDTVSHSSKG